MVDREKMYRGEWRKRDPGRSARGERANERERVAGREGNGRGEGERRVSHGRGRWARGEAEDGREVTPTRPRVGATSKGTDFASFAR